MSRPASARRTSISSSCTTASPRPSSSTTTTWACASPAVPLTSSSPARPGATAACRSTSPAASSPRGTPCRPPVSPTSGRSRRTSGARRATVRSRAPRSASLTSSVWDPRAECTSSRRQRDNQARRAALDSLRRTDRHGARARRCGTHVKVDVSSEGTLGPGPARLAEEGGYDAVWYGETMHDPFVSTAMAAEGTSRVQLGAGVAVALARSPMTLSVTANDLQLVSEGRLLLGLGSQVKAHITRRFSMPWVQPVDQMREFVLATRAIWRSWHEGERLDFQGDYYSHTLMTPFFNPGPSPFGPPPVLLAAVNPRMSSLAGEVADGFMCHGFATERYLREVVVPSLRSGREKAGKDLEGFEISGLPFVVTGTTEEEAAEAAAGVRDQIAFYAATPAYRGVLELHGWGELQTELSAMTKAGRWKERGGLIDDEMLNAFAVVAEPEDVAAEVLKRYGEVFTRLHLYLKTELDREVVSGIREQLQAGA